MQQRKGYFIIMQTELLPHLFRTEYTKIVSVLSKLFGIAHIEIAEDIASETFVTAAEFWGINGVPQNPTAWLYAVAKNKAKDYYRHNQIFTQKIAPQLTHDTDEIKEPDIDLSNQSITDSQLQMMFAICHPSISAEAQISLSLRVLCGFGIDEIADAFLINRETVKKRLFRAKETLRNKGISIALPSKDEVARRLETVLTTLYLLFTEGYYSAITNSVLRKDLCREAMRLTYLLLENELACQPQVNALLSLMCFHASRFEARTNATGEVILYDDQDESLWSTELIAKGIAFLNRASVGSHLSKYHLEAGIAYWHTQKADSEEKWQSILQLYNQLLQIAYSPVAALNRTYTLSKVKGKCEAIREAEKLPLTNHYLYHWLLGELYSNVDDEHAILCLQNALRLSRSVMDKKTIENKISKIKQAGETIIIQRKNK